MKEWMSRGSGIKSVTPGKWVLKKSGSLEGSSSRVVKWEDGRKRVHVNEPFWMVSQ